MGVVREGPGLACRSPERRKLIMSGRHFQAKRANCRDDRPENKHPADPEEGGEVSAATESLCRDALSATQPPFHGKMPMVRKSEKRKGAQAIRMIEGRSAIRCM